MFVDAGVHCRTAGVSTTQWIQMLPQTLHNLTCSSTRFITGEKSPVVVYT